MNRNIVILLLTWAVSNVWAGDGRIEICQADISNRAYQIRESGSYVLTENLLVSSNFNAIEVTGNNVSIDLNGFAIVGTNQLYSGIFSRATNVTVRNGTVARWSNLNYGGIHLSGPGCCVERVTVCENYNGIMTGPGALIHDCQVVSNANMGISTEGGLVMRCLIVKNPDVGIRTKQKTLMKDCHVAFNGTGVFCFSNNYIRANTLINNSAYGLENYSVQSAGGNRVDDNEAQMNGSSGFVITMGTNLCIRNKSTGSIDNFNLRCARGEETTATSGMVMLQPAPWANISY